MSSRWPVPHLCGCGARRHGVQPCLYPNDVRCGDKLPLRAKPTGAHDVTTDRAGNVRTEINGAPPAHPSPVRIWTRLQTRQEPSPKLDIIQFIMKGNHKALAPLEPCGGTFRMNSLCPVWGGPNTNDSKNAYDQDWGRVRWGGGRLQRELPITRQGWVWLLFAGSFSP